MVKCIICRERTAELPDRDATSPHKRVCRVCRVCHRARIREDLRYVLADWEARKTRKSNP